MLMITNKGKYSTLIPICTNAVPCFGLKQCLDIHKTLQIKQDREVANSKQSLKYISYSI